MGDPELLVGTCGFGYREWAHGLYAGVPRRRWLERYAERFDAVEIDASFYRRLAADTVRRWLAQTPERFRFCIKGHRMVTHVARLRGAAASVAVQRQDAAVFGERLAAVVWQLPAGLERDDDRLDAFLDLLVGWPEVRHVLEFRHPSWFVPDTVGRLAERGVASCASDAGAWPLWDAVTADLAYLRLHGRPRTYASPYAEPALARWAERIGGWRAEGRAVYTFFDNTAEGAAPEDALRLRALLGQTRSANVPARL
jgi:uncharacterized protein YecE (DUF72 family)